MSDQSMQRPTADTDPATRCKQLRSCGQAVWLDFVERKFIGRGELQEAGRRGRPERRHLQPVDLRKGDRPQRRL